MPVDGHKRDALGRVLEAPFSEQPGFTGGMGLASCRIA